MSTVSSLPVEIWEKILRLSIALPDFLEPDLEEDDIVESLYNEVYSPVSDEMVYWNAEKTRNQLQLVSKAWDRYLRRYEHRYVRMMDIRHGKVETKALEKAIRISFGRCEGLFPACCGNLTEFGRFCRNTLETIECSDAEIVDMRSEGRPFVLPESCRTKFVHVKTLLAHRCDHYGTIVRIIGALPNLGRASTGRLYGKIEAGYLHPKFSSRTLHTLTWRVPFSVPCGAFVLELPSLRHLLITCPSLDTLGNGKTSILSVLRAVGGQLHSLLLCYHPRPNETLEELWELCPNLEILYTRFPLSSSPPQFHPICMLAVDHKHQLEGLIPLPEWPNLRRVVILHLGRIFDHYDSDTLSVVASRRGARLEEVDRFILKELRGAKG